MFEMFDTKFSEQNINKNEVYNNNNNINVDYQMNKNQQSNKNCLINVQI